MPWRPPPSPTRADDLLARFMERSGPALLLARLEQRARPLMPAHMLPLLLVLGQLRALTPEDRSPKVQQALPVIRVMFLFTAKACTALFSLTAFTAKTFFHNLFFFFLPFCFYFLLTHSRVSHS